MIYYLIYISQATELMSESQLENILKQSRKNNKSLGITGMLLYVEGQFINNLTRKLVRTLAGRFIQILEGDEADVKSVYELLQTDFRHFDLMILKEGVVPERNFENWQMGFRRIGSSGHENSAEFVDLDRLLLDWDGSKNANEPLNFMMSFYRMSKSKQ